MRTVAPSLYSLDSAEFAIGAADLSIVHAPGYPLYLVVTHGFVSLLGGDVAARTNLFSALSLALTAPVLYGTLAMLTGFRWAALGATLSFVWAYYVWANGIVAEIYATQTLSLAAFVALIVTMHQHNGQYALLTGAAFGVALALHPGSILFAPGVVIAFLMLPLSWRSRTFAAGICVLIFGISLLYFPLRSAAAPALNLAGTYDARGEFDAVNLRSLSGIGWMITGQQFDTLFFAEGPFPSINQLREVFGLLWANTLGAGLAIGVLGLYAMWKADRCWSRMWVALTAPYTYFYFTYGATDIETMLTPLYLLWAIPVGYGFAWLLANAIPARVGPIVMLVLPAAMLAINYSLLDLSGDYSVRTRAQSILEGIPADAVVFGHWWDITPIQYLQIVEGQRMELTLYNQFLFSQEDYEAYVAWHLAMQPTPIVILGTVLPDIPGDMRITIRQLVVSISHSGKTTDEPIIAGFVLQNTSDFSSGSTF